MKLSCVIDMWASVKYKRFSNIAMGFSKIAIALRKLSQHKRKIRIEKKRKGKQKGHAIEGTQDRFFLLVHTHPRVGLYQLRHTSGHPSGSAAPPLTLPPLAPTTDRWPPVVVVVPLSLCRSAARDLLYHRR
jgi:hypothetical protein